MMQGTEACPRSEHPRPDFQRDTFYNLNGEWGFAFDDDDRGLKERWYVPGYRLERKITVPFCYQCAAGGLGPDRTIHPILWYRRSFCVPADMRDSRILLRFGAVDYACRVYVNGSMAGTHEGGYLPFALDITDLLREGENDLCLRVTDDRDCIQPRGKQYWDEGTKACWYTPVSGIWQTVYLEAVGDLGIRYIHITPDVDRHMATAEILLDHLPREEYEVRLQISLNGKPYKTCSATGRERLIRIPVDMVVHGGWEPVELWQPGKPVLYDVAAAVTVNGRQTDRVRTYFGMRKIEVRDGNIYLNNRLLYQRLVLDQGYWQESLLTPPSDDAIRFDIRAALDMGFNGVRKHQKIEDPRFYYWADRMGLLVWGEMPSVYMHSDESVRRLADTMMGFMERDYNHPSIIVWTPMNESWGVRQVAANVKQQQLVSMLYHLTKAADGTRLCSSNDGWEQMETDICALHDYTAGKEELKMHFAGREQVEKSGCFANRTYADNAPYTGREAFLVTEYGGIAFDNTPSQGEDSWGYNGRVHSTEEFMQRYRASTDAVREIPYCQGYCYTQLTDVMQEINGLLTMDRKFKVSPEALRACNTDPDGKQGRG